MKSPANRLASALVGVAATLAGQLAAVHAQVAPTVESIPTSFEMTMPQKDDGQMPSAEESRKWFEWLAQRGYSIDRCGYDPRKGTFVINIESLANQLAGERRELLLDAGFQVVRRLDAAPLEGANRTQSQYFDPDEIAAMLAQTATDHPDITRLFSIGTTAEGRNIWAIEISNNPGVEEDEPAIQFNGQHHAREVATSHVVMDVVDTLTNGYSVDTTITSWVDDFKTVCVPMVNPDGVQYVFDVNSFWRKNRQQYPPSCIGVDLNRNYPYRWGPDRCGFASSCSGDTYPGPSVASELETGSMVSLAEQFHFVMATSYHSSGRFIDYPYACSNGSPSTIMPEHTVIDEMMNGVADAINAVDAVPRYTVFSPASAGPLSGDDTSWYYAAQGVYSFIIEVGTSFEPAFSQVAGIVSRNQGGWMYMYNRLGQARIDVHVTDGCTGAPLAADVTLTDFLFDTGESARLTFMPFGRWTFLVVANGTYTVQVSKSGYITQELSAAVANTPVALNVELQPEGNCSSIPTTTLWGLLIMVLSILVSGSVVFRRYPRRSNPCCHPPGI